MSKIVKDNKMKMSKKWFIGIVKDPEGNNMLIQPILSAIFNVETIS
jgi:hypothetical protein